MACIGLLLDGQVNRVGNGSVPRWLVLLLLLAPDIRLSSCPMATPFSSTEAGIRKTKEVRTN